MYGSQNEIHYTQPYFPLPTRQPHACFHKLFCTSHVHYQMVEVLFTEGGRLKTVCGRKRGAVELLNSRSRTTHLPWLTAISSTTTSISLLPIILWVAFAMWSHWHVVLHRLGPLMIAQIGSSQNNEALSEGRNVHCCRCVLLEPSHGRSIWRVVSQWMSYMFCHCEFVSFNLLQVAIVA